MKNEDFRIVPFGPYHYAMVSAWWREHKFAEIPLSALPKNGLIIYLGDEPLSAGFLYKTDSDFCLTEWIVTNPKAPLKARTKSIDFLLDQLCCLARQSGCKIVFMSLSSRGLVERAKGSGYTVTDLNMTNLIRRLS